MTQDELDTKFRELRSFLRDEIGDMRVDLRERVEGVTDQLKELNGRTRASEIEIAILNDRSTRAEAAATAALTQARDTGWKWGGGAGAGIAGAIIGAWKLLSGGQP